MHALPSCAAGITTPLLSEKYRIDGSFLTLFSTVAINSSTVRTAQQFNIFKLCSMTNTEHIYMEKQEKAFCLVHAFSMALGSRTLNGNLVLKHIHQMERTLNECSIRDVVQVRMRRTMSQQLAWSWALVCAGTACWRALAGALGCIKVSSLCLSWFSACW